MHEPLNDLLHRGNEAFATAALVSREKVLFAMFTILLGAKRDPAFDHSLIGWGTETVDGRVSASGLTFKAHVTETKSSRSIFDIQLRTANVGIAGILSPFGLAQSSK